jgi:GT2 family glycosyltransferase
LLNSDAVVAPDTLATLEGALAIPAVGIAGPLVLLRSDPDRVASAGIGWHPTTGRMRHHAAGERTAKRTPDLAPRVVDGVSGCAMLVRASVFAATGPLDGATFFSFEDLDFCLRARAVGFATMVAPRARVWHEGARTLAAVSADRLYYGTRNHLRLAAREPGAGWLRSACVLAWNAAHAVLTAHARRGAGLLAVAEGFRDHLRGRYGPRPS